MVKRKSKGRQKITMAKMGSGSNLQVTFSKRRSGLFKKANELSILTGAEVGVLVFSPGEKVFSFGHPSVEAVSDKFLTVNTQQSTRAQDLMRAQRDGNVREMSTRITNLKNLLEVEKKRGEDLEVMMAMSRSQRWWEAPFEDLGLEQLEQVCAAMKELQSDMNKESERRRLAGQNFYREGGCSTIMPSPVETNYYGHEAMPSLTEPTYLGGGSSILPSLVGASCFGGGEGSSSGGGGNSNAFMPFPVGAGYYGHGSMPSLVGPTNIGSGSSSTFPSLVGQSCFGGGEGSSSGAFSRFSPQPNAYGLGGGDHGDGGLSIMNRSSSPRDGSSASQSHARISKSDGSMTPHGHDRRF